MKAYKFILLILITGILFSAKQAEKQYEEYQGGRFGYSGVTIKLYSDSTYYFSEWIHVGSSLADTGKWGKENQNYYLNSITKTRWKGSSEKSKEFLRFEKQKFVIDHDTLRFLPNDPKDNEYYLEYYTFSKITKGK